MTDVIKSPSVALNPSARHYLPPFSGQQQKNEKQSGEIEMLDTDEKENGSESSFSYENPSYSSRENVDKIVEKTKKLE